MTEYPLLLKIRLDRDISIRLDAEAEMLDHAVHEFLEVDPTLNQYFIRDYIVSSIKRAQRLDPQVKEVTIRIDSPISPYMDFPKEFLAGYMEGLIE